MFNVQCRVSMPILSADGPESNRTGVNLLGLFSWRKICQEGI
jgi:hypothetical protein